MKGQTDRQVNYKAAATQLAVLATRHNASPNAIARLIVGEGIEEAEVKQDKVAKEEVKDRGDQHEHEPKCSLQRAANR